MVSIQIQQIEKSFGTKPVLKNVNLEIQSGEFFFLLGPSGCGKTTLLRLLAGFEQPDSGDLRFDNHSVLAIPPHKRNTAMVFQHYALWPHMTVEQNVQYGLDERGLAREDKARRVKRALERVRMQDYHSRFPNQLSGGQQQRVALARALIIEPDVVLMDEPLSNLDARLREEMRDEIRSLHHETGMTMVYVTHDQHEALSMAGRMAVMCDGTIEQVGTPSAIYEQPVNRFVGDFLGTANWIPGVLESIDGPVATVRTEDAIIRGHIHNTAIKPGHNVLCMLRPENLELCLTASDQRHANSLSAKLERRVFLGAATELHLATKSGSLCALHSGRVSTSLMPTQTIQLTFDPENTVILPHP